MQTIFTPEWMTQNLPLVIVASVWTLAWKGVALWRSAQLGQKPWFIAILILNTFGLLEIIYLFVIAKKYKVEVIEKQ